MGKQARIAIVGGGPAGLMAAEIAARGGAAVTLYERMPSPGRKFLLAGRGGLNLTHSEDFEAFVGRYGDAAAPLRVALEAFPPADMRQWSEDLGQPTFVGSSGRVFPAAMKASPLLRAWLARLNRSGVAFRLRYSFAGWENGRLVFETPAGRVLAESDATVLALGGASWPRLGADGSWIAPLAEAGIRIAPLRPANCGFAVAWSEIFRTRFQGAPLKRLALRFGAHRARGEAVITATGLEGGGIYALSAPLREAIAASGEALLCIDLRPDRDVADLARRIAAPRGAQSLSTFLRRALQLAPVEIGLLQEATAGRLAQRDADAIAQLIKAVPLRLVATAALARAISTAGGIVFDELDSHFMLRRRPGLFVAGEMLDWEAPTGGYLLQACFATGAAAARGALAFCRAAGA